jgi:hypothetical protein
MRALFLPFTARFVVLTLCIALTAACVGLAMAHSAWLGPLSVPILLFGGFSLLGIRDLFQTRHAVLRNYPISAHLRFLLEQIRPEMRQYFFESEKDGMPFSRDKRAVIYQRAKMALDSVLSGPSTTSIPTVMNGCAIRSRPSRSPPYRSVLRSADRVAPSPLRPQSSTFRP